jgi:putative nucleotidyltransferase with HDIG domain
MIRFQAAARRRGVTELAAPIAHEEIDRRARLRAAASLAIALEVRHASVGSHSHAVGWLAARLAARLGLSCDEVELVRLAGSLHDLGKIAITEEIIGKPGPLDAAERVLLRRHPRVAYRMLTTVGIEPVATWVLHAHEHWDGSGYPGRLAGDEIPLPSRIVLVADAYDSMTRDRPYRRRIPEERALAEIVRCAGTQFDPEVVGALALELAELADMEGALEGVG